MRSLTVFLAAALFLSSASCFAVSAQAGGVNSAAGKDPGAAIAADSSGFNDLLVKARSEKTRGCYGEAGRLYRLALASAPPEKREGISVELGTVLGWSGDYKGAIEVFSGVIETDPLNRDARLGLARSYSWAKEYERSKAEYRRVLKEDPNNAEARIGLARVYSWEGGEGSLKESEALYREVLAKDPNNEEARIGLAKALLWRGDLDGSLKEAGEAVRNNPGDTEAAKFERRLREEKGPELGFLWASSSDSDSNDLTTYRATGYLNASPLLRLSADYSRFDASRHSDKAHADIITVRDSIKVSKDLTVTPRLSMVSTGSDAGGTTYPAGGLSADWGFYRDTTAFFSYTLYPLVDTPALIRNNIRVAETTAAVMHSRGDFTASLGASYGDYSDGNTVTGVRGNIAWKAHGSPDVVVGYIPDFREFSKKTNSGYFNPHDIISHNLYLMVAGGLYGDAVEYELTGTAGVESFDSTSEYVSAFRAKVTGHLTRNFSAFAGYKWSRSALESASGFRFEEWRAGLDYLF